MRLRPILDEMRSNGAEGGQAVCVKDSWEEERYEELKQDPSEFGRRRSIQRLRTDMKWKHVATEPVCNRKLNYILRIPAFQVEDLLVLSLQVFVFCEYPHLDCFRIWLSFHVV